jgi:pyruvate/2-oxoglutarate/acetoin dehydrogenase E1 component
MTGMRPVAEIMYVDFLGVAMDQIFNQAAKIRYMFGGKAKVPMTLRTEGGTGRGLAAHHSQSLESWFLHVPGLKVVMPATPYDAKGLLKASIRDDNPVLFIEHKMLYGTKGKIPDGEYIVPLGLAEVKKPGKDVTVVAHSRMLLYALEAAETLEKEGISVEVIDPRTLAPLDMDTIMTSVKKTGRVVLVEEGCKTGGVGGEIATKIMEEGFYYLDAPIIRVAAKDVPIPMSPALEPLAVPSVEEIIDAVKKLYV